MSKLPPLGYNKYLDGPIKGTPKPNPNIDPKTGLWIGDVYHDNWGFNSLR